MHSTRRIRRTLAATSVAAIAVAGAAALPAAAGAQSPPGGTGPTQGPNQSAKASQLEQRLMKQLQLRQTQLANLLKEVQETTFVGTDQGELEQKVSDASTSIDGLVQAVPTDTLRELRAAERTMIRQNRVFAVLTPQVYEVISSDTVAIQATTFFDNEPGLLSLVNSAYGQAGYKDADAHLQAYEAAVTRAQGETAKVSSTLLDQIPTDYPHDSGVFVRANHQILLAADALARASYDKTIIALAANGYTGS